MLEVVGVSFKEEQGASTRANQLSFLCQHTELVIQSVISAHSILILSDSIEIHKFTNAALELERGHTTATFPVFFLLRILTKSFNKESCRREDSESGVATPIAEILEGRVSSGAFSSLELVKDSLQALSHPEHPLYTGSFLLRNCPCRQLLMEK